jgi:SAM-dependent methyltransferase
MTLALREELEQLYFDSSKHAVYQSLPEFVEKALGLTIQLNHNWRSDKPRYDYLIQKISFEGTRVVDIGANTGYFALCLAQAYGASVTAYEANPNHARIIARIAGEFDLPNVSVKAEGLGLDELDALAPCDVVLFSNVAHHAGHDFDRDKVPSREALKDHLVAYLTGLSTKAKFLFFQMGFNWGGNKQMPIVPVGDNAEKLRYAADAFERSGWSIRSAALGYKNGETISFVDVDWARIVEGVDERAPGDSLADLVRQGISQEGMSEFYRRPLFICERKGRG